ncbi:hypothetical protein PHYSODRAFT_387567, partial [Phytophthora sojae]
VDWCGCEGSCEAYVCPNSRTDIFCAPNNCLVGLFSGNRLRELPHGLELRKTSRGVGVFATRFFSSHTVIGEYSGVMTTHDFNKDKVRTSDYVLKLNKRSIKGKRVYIDAKNCRAISRFMNHAC